MGSPAPLDEVALAILRKLGDPPEGAPLCSACLVAAIDADRWELLASVRSLIVAGEVSCYLDRCSSCHAEHLVVGRRPEPFTRSIRG